MFGIIFAQSFWKTHLAINDRPSTGDFVVATDPVVDRLGWLCQIHLGDTRRSQCKQCLSYVSQKEKEGQLTASDLATRGKMMLENETAPGIAHL